MSKRTGRTRKSPRGVGALLDARFFRALGDPNRIALLDRLSSCRRPCCVSELSECCPTDVSVTARHLVLLRDAGILDAEKCGKEVRYTVRFDDLAGKLRAMADAIAHCCPPKGEGTKET